MLDGKPGAVLGLLGKAREVCAAVQKLKKGEGLAAVDVIDVASAALGQVGLVHQFSHSEFRQSSAGKGVFVTVHVRMDVIAPDGSWMRFDAPAGAMSPQLKSVQAAVTSGQKTLFRHALTMEVLSENEPAPAPALTETMRAWLDYLDQLHTIEELKTASQHETRRALRNDELMEGKHALMRRRSEIVDMNAAERQEWQRAQRLKAEELHEASDADRRAAIQAKHGAPKDALSISETRPVPPRKRRIK